MTSGVMARDWQQILARRSFLEGDALDRARALLDPDGVRVLCGPFDRLESPWLEPQGIVPQADDGVVIARGTVDGRPAVIASIEQGFQGGGTGEVSGAKISQALHWRPGCQPRRDTAAVLLFETGGVRLQEANLGLNAVAESARRTRSAPDSTGDRGGGRRGRLVRRHEHRRRIVHSTDHHPAG